MNDRYLYRAKRTDNGDWIKGYLFRLSENHPPFIMLSDRYGESHEVDPSTICQCTSLEDKNGKLIFENDIVRCGKNCTVTWCDTFASWRLNTSGWMYSHFFGEACKPEDVEIVGNILAIQNCWRRENDRAGSNYGI